MTTDNRTLKRLSLEFRDIASNALRSNDADARRNLRRLLPYVENQDLLRTTIASSGGPVQDVGQAWSRAIEHGEHYPYPESELEELGHLHALIKFLSTDSGQDFWQVCYGYGGVRSGSTEEAVSSVLHEVVGRYVNSLNRVIELALLDSSDTHYGPARQIQVTVSGGAPQVNIAQDHGSVKAIAQAGSTLQDLTLAAQQLMSALSTQAGQESTEAAEAARAIKGEAGSRSPNRFTMKAAVERLDLYAKAATAATQVAPYLRKVIDLVQRYLSDTL